MGGIPGKGHARGVARSRGHGQGKRCRRGRGRGRDEGAGHEEDHVTTPAVPLLDPIIGV